jgi:5'-3' exonuclease
MSIEFFHEQLLTGDTVDNIPGIEGIGKVKAGRIY